VLQATTDHLSDVLAVTFEGKTVIVQDQVISQLRWRARPLDARRWNDSRPQGRQRVDPSPARQVGDPLRHGAIEAVKHKHVHDGIESDAVPDPPPNVTPLATPPPAASALVEYYRTRRSQYQLAFFRTRAD